MRNGVCPKCQGTSIYRGKLIQDTKPMYILVADSDSFFKSDMDRFHIFSYVCAHCGYMELYISDEGETGRPREAWLNGSHTKEWTRVIGSGA